MSSTFCTSFPAPFSASTQDSVQDALPSPPREPRHLVAAASPPAGFSNQRRVGSRASASSPGRRSPSRRRAQLQASERCTNPWRERRGYGAIF